MSSPQKLILVVEDEPDTAEMFAEMMRLNGFRVVKTYYSASAMGILSQAKPDVVVLDLMMPDVSGMEVLKFVRREPELDHVPVVVVSAKSMPADIREALEAGATFYLTKPVAYGDLMNAVEKAIDGGSPDSSAGSP